MSLLQDKDREQVQQLFAGLSNPVKLVMFTQELDCEFCAQTRELVEEVASLSDTITAEVYNFALDKEKAQEYGVEKIPAVAVVGDKDYGIRFYGIPSGYEFSSLLDSIMDVSAQDSGLSETTSTFLASLKDPLHIQVFVTPT
ncbi:MAG: thioredoxin family protein [Chloroflexota bacterium]